MNKIGLKKTVKTLKKTLIKIKEDLPKCKADQKAEKLIQDQKRK